MSKKTAKKASKKTAKRAKRANRKSIIERLTRKPLRELVRSGGLISEAISLKTRRTLEKKGLFFGPSLPTASDKRWMAEQKKASVKEKRLAALERTREKKYEKLRHGPVFDPQQRLQVSIMKRAGII
jgi:hypothetical protein